MNFGNGLVGGLRDDDEDDDDCEEEEESFDMGLVDNLTWAKGGKLPDFVQLSNVMPGQLEKVFILESFMQSRLLRQVSAICQVEFVPCMVFLVSIESQMILDRLPIRRPTHS